MARDHGGLARAGGLRRAPRAFELGFCPERRGSTSRGEASGIFTTTSFGMPSSDGELPRPTSRRSVFPAASLGLAAETAGVLTLGDGLRTGTFLTSTLDSPACRFICGAACCSFGDRC